MRIKAKELRRTYRKSKKLYERNLHLKLRNLKSNNPKEYWDILNIKNKGSSVSGNVSLENFTNHFKNLCEHEQEVIHNDLIYNNIPDENLQINKPFTVDEVTKVFKSLKNNKACGDDMILNEFLKHSPEECYILLTKYFNLILDTGNVPSDWCIGLIQPVFKKKGSPEDPDNYRGITLLSCLSKAFTALLNNRLGQFLENNDILGEEQAGFRHDYSTIDHIFTLHTLIEMYLQKGSRMFCAFVDYRKAFDFINRYKLWYKLIKNGISGKILTVMQNLYKNAKSYVKNGLMKSQTSFKCNIGLRQGENLSPLLFSIYLNDFENVLSSSHNGLKYIADMSNTFESESEVMLNLYLLLYADDTIIMSENSSDLQCALNELYLYCSDWDLNVNTSKTKIVIFSKGKVRKKPVFNFGDSVLDVVDDYVYLGCTFNYNGKYNKAINDRLIQGRRAMFGLISKSNQMSLPLDITSQLFDSVVSPVLLYACEVWGCENIYNIEKLHVKFCKFVLKLNKTTANCMALGELGRLKLRSVIDKRMISYWIKLVNGKENKISCKLYKLSKTMFENEAYKPRWLIYVKKLLDNCGFSDVWNTFYLYNPKWLQYTIHNRIDDIAKQEWVTEVYNNSLCVNYRIFKNNVGFSHYLTILGGKSRVLFTRFRCGNHKLPVNTGRYEGIDRSSRTCKLCNQSSVADEYHYLFECTDQELINIRKKYVKPYYYNNHNALKMNILMNSTKKQTLDDLAIFVNAIMNKF